MLAKTLYTEDETTDCCCTVYCKCLNTKIDFINQSLNRDEAGTDEYVLLETLLDNQNEYGINSTLFCRSFLLSINIKFKWLIGRTLISHQHGIYLYKCHCCSYDLFVSTNNILGKCLINFELQNFNKDIIQENINYSPSFHILIPQKHTNQSQIRSVEMDETDSETHTNTHTHPFTNPLRNYVNNLREKEENDMKKRMEAFKQQEERKFNKFCSNLDIEYHILNQYAAKCNKPFDFKINSFTKIEKDFHNLMQENLKLDNEDVYNYLDSDDIQLNTNDHDPDMHNICIKLPLNEMGEIIQLFSPNINDLHSHINDEDDDSSEITDPPSQTRSIHESPSGTMVEHNNVNLYDEEQDFEDENMGFAAISEEEEDENDENDENAEQLMFELDINEDNSLTQTPTRSTMKLYNNRSESKDIILEDSETDDRIFGIDDLNNNNNAFTRLRGVASASKNDSLRPVILSPLTSSNFKIKSSKSLRIKSTFQSKSLLSKTLNKNSALVNLNKKNNENMNNENDMKNDYDYNYDNQNINPKTFNPPKQWLDVLKQSSPNYKQKHITRYKNNGVGKSLTVNNHTFTGIWSNIQSDNGYNMDEDNRDDKKTNNVHSLFDDKQNQQSNNVYAYSMTPKYSVKQSDQ